MTGDVVGLEHVTSPNVMRQEYVHSAGCHKIPSLHLFVNTEALEHQYLEPVVDNVRRATYIFDVLTLDMLWMKRPGWSDCLLCQLYQTILVECTTKLPPRNTI
jgi:hypothetical protein